MYSIIISFRKVHTSVLGYSRKKNKQGVGEYGVSRVIEEIASGFCGGIIKSKGGGRVLKSLSEEAPLYGG